VGQGKGLGLSISYAIVVDEHGGQLRCLSVPGQGATLAIEIPIHHSKKHFYKEDVAGL
jgi:signal transduction histidine kinase